MSMAMPSSYILLCAITLLSPAVIPTPAGGAKFDYLNVHELHASTRRHPPYATPHLNPAAEGRSVGGNLSLELFRRESISSDHHATHRNRVAAFIRRDHRRIASLQHRLSYHPTDFRSDVVSGLQQGSGEYFVRVGVGSPAREQYLVVDSGSDVVWVQCEPCAQCYTQADPVFDPARSVSFTAVACDSPICTLLSSSRSGTAGCASGRCRYQVSYGDGSYTRGTLALETLTFGEAAVNDVAIGCGNRNHGLFVWAAGLLGLGWGPLSFIGQLGGLAGGAFAYCLPSRGAAAGRLVFGRSTAVPAGAVWVPLLRNPRAPSFYYVGITGLGIRGERLAAVGEDEFRLTAEGGGGTVVDTGTAVTRLPVAAYAALRDGFAAAAVGLPRAAGVSIFDTCYALGGYGSVRVPTVSFYFAGGAQLTLPARNFLIPVDDAGTFCFAFAPSASSLSILGNIQQEGIQITVDTASGFLGFGPNTC